MLLPSLALAAPASADEINTRAAIGGGLGALIGSEVGGRNGAVLGGGLGEALGSVVAVDGYRELRYVERHYYDPVKRGKHHRHRRGRGHWDH
jgi:hypothetical protein